MKNWTRAIAFSTLLAFGASSVGCGYILYPERRGNSGGTVDGGTLVMDLLWLLPGIVRVRAAGELARHRTSIGICIGSCS